MLKLYDTLSRKKEVFKPLRGKKIKLFVCGVTPYNFTHLGHARTYIVFDMIVKYLRQNSYDVYYLQNITNIDDKIINRAKETKTSWNSLGLKFEKEFLKDVKALKINSVTKYARATDHIKEIISQIKRLLKKGFAYQIEDGIYYDISKFKDYGKLSRRTVLRAQDAISRIDENIKKRNRGDFCLWKFGKIGEPKWPAPFGAGRPGWHIEDTAITEKYFGSQYDIHGGGMDLIFPHHEAEIAQMEAISGKKPLVKYWLHTGFLAVNGQKMSKSLGNFITIKDFLKNHPARLLRFLVIKSHYRSPIDYSEKIISQTEKELERIDEFVNRIKNSKTESRKSGTKVKMRTKSSSPFKISELEKQFNMSMEDDFNTPKAMAVIFNLVNQGNSLIAQNKLGKKETKNILEFLKKSDEFFNFIFWKKSKEVVPEEVLGLTKQRQKYRKEGLWRKADEIRNKIKNLGWQVEDTKEGPVIKRNF
jgi:cysteinyl-tRNA synthetase